MSDINASKHFKEDDSSLFVLDTQGRQLYGSLMVLRWLRQEWYLVALMCRPSLSGGCKWQPFSSPKAQLETFFWNATHTHGHRRREKRKTLSALHTADKACFDTGCSTTLFWFIDLFSCFFTFRMCVCVLHQARTFCVLVDAKSITSLSVIRMVKYYILNTTFVFNELTQMYQTGAIVY